MMKCAYCHFYGIKFNYNDNTIKPYCFRKNLDISSLDPNFNCEDFKIKFWYMHRIKKGRRLR